MNSQPLFSIITIVYNDSENLERTILSIINQPVDIEYVVVDGGSTDNTVNIIKKYDSKITKWISEPDKGIYDAMNKGMAMATGKYYCFVNSGDFYVPGILATVKDNIESEPEVDLFFGKTNWYLPVNEKLYYSPQKIRPESRLKVAMNACHQSYIIKAKVFDELGYYRTDFKVASDYYILLHAYRSGYKFKYLPFEITYFLHGGATSSPSDLLMIREYAKVKFLFGNYTNAIYYTCKRLLYAAYEKTTKLIVGQQKFNDLFIKNILNNWSILE